jgi:hypothetical protein
MVECLHLAALQRAMYFTREDEVYTIELYANILAETGIATLNKAGMDSDMGRGRDRVLSTLTGWTVVDLLYNYRCINYCVKRHRPLTPAG